MTWKVLITAPYMQPVVDRFRPVFAEHDIEIVVPHVEERMEAEDLLPIIHDIDGVICGDDRFTAAVLDAAPNLKVISKWGTGIDSIDQEACAERGIAVRNTPDAFSQPVADTVLGYMLAFARNIPWMDRHMKAGNWEKIQGVALHECTLGVIGVGDVGRAVLRRAAAFGITLVGNDIRTIDEAFIDEVGLTMLSKDDLLERADFVSLNCDLNPTSYHLMSTDEFKTMKPTAIVINTSRGPVVDEDALVHALQNEHIAGAALDVFEFEPLPADSPLLTMDNVLLAPHNSNSSPTAWEKVHHNTINNLVTVLKETANNG